MSNNFTKSTPVDLATILHTFGEHKSLINIKNVNDRDLILKNISIYNDTEAVFLWKLILNLDIDIDESDINSTMFTEKTRILTSGYSNKTEIIDLTNLLDNHKFTKGDIITLSVEYAGGSSRIRGTISWVENDKSYFG